MENSDSSLEELEDSSEESIEIKNKWSNNYENEKKIWSDLIIKKYCYKTNIYFTCLMEILF